MFRKLPSKRNALRLALMLCALAPGTLMLFLVAKDGVNISYSDEWTFAPMLVKAHEGSLRLGDLLALQNEHRFFLPKLIFIAVAFLGGGNLRLEMFMSVALCCVTSWNVWLLLQRTTATSFSVRLLLLSLCNLLLFSPVQAENWTWGLSVVHFLINALLTTALVVATSRHSLNQKFVICAILAVLASFSFGSGFVLWPVTFPVALLAAHQLPTKRRWHWAFLWIAAAAATAALYSIHYTKPGHHPPVAASRSLIKYVHYVLNFLGGGLWQRSRFEHSAVAEWLGAVVIALFIAAVITAALARQRELRTKLLPWLALGAAALLNAAMAAATRIGFGQEQALSSRYATYSLLLPVSIIGMLSVVSEALRSQSDGRSSALTWLGRLEGALLVIFIVTTVGSSSWGVDEMAASGRSRRWGKTALLFGNVLDSSRVYERELGGWGPDVLRFANLQNGLGLLHPPLAATADLRRLPATSPANILLGQMESASCAANACVASGWAVLPKRRRVADCVVLAYERPDGAPVAFSVMDETSDRPDIGRWAHNPAVIRSGWAGHFSREAVPLRSPVAISAWAVDSATGALYELRNRQQLLP